MRTNNQTIQTAAIILVLYFGLFVSNIILNHVPVAYSQNQDSSFQANVSAIHTMPAQKVKVDDIEIAYKKLGSGSGIPILLITGGGVTMDTWNPTLLNELSSNRTVIIFDNRGAGESTIGTREFSINQFANDTVGLLDALKIQKADVLGFSMGSFIAQELALTNPTRVNNLVLYASICGGMEAIPSSPQVIQALNTMMTNTSSSPTQVEIDTIIATLFPSDWLKANPDYQNYMPLPNEFVSPKIFQRQAEAIESWSTKGTCNALQNITHSTLVIVGTEDMLTPSGNSLMIAEKIPAAWLVQIRDAGHGLMDQYPDKFSKIISTFLQTVS